MDKFRTTYSLHDHVRPPTRHRNVRTEQTIDSMSENVRKVSEVSFVHLQRLKPYDHRLHLAFTGWAHNQYGSEVHLFTVKFHSVTSCIFG